MGAFWGFNKRVRLGIGIPPLLRSLEVEFEFGREDE